MGHRMGAVVSLVLFNSARPLGRCENVTAVWDACDMVKRFERIGYGDLSRHSDCSVVVTDEFVRGKSANQSAVMIAHGLTGGKLYGNDQRHGQFTRDTCSLVDWYVVSSEAGIQLAASAAGIPESRCLPLGMPRTDAYFGMSRGDGGTFLAKFGRAYLYAPTFRARYDPPRGRIDWAVLDELMDDDEILVVKRHPIVSRHMVEQRLVHIVEADPREPSTPYLVDCSVLATDFSSILFDGYVLGKPSVLTADETDGYLAFRGMYWRYPGQYGSRSVSVEGNERQFLELLRDAADNGMGHVELACRERTAGACDGYSTNRVLDLVRGLL